MARRLEAQRLTITSIDGQDRRSSTTSSGSAIQLQKPEFPTFMSVYISKLNIRVEKGIQFDLEGKKSLTHKSQVITG